MPYGEIGELCFHTPSQMLHYLHNERETKEIKRMHKDGLEWIHTGDLGWIDRDGFVYFKGRIKRIYMRKALDGTIYKIFPTQVEELLSNLKSIEKCAVIAVENADTLHDLIEEVIAEHSDVKKCAVVGIPNGKKGYLTKAYVISGCSDEENLRQEIWELCSRKLPQNSQPTEIKFVNELPVTSAGKVDYRELENRAIGQR